MGNSKQEKIISMFDQIASKYDLTNRIISLGIDKRWRLKACKLALSRLKIEDKLKIVDVACGTGDMIGSWQKSVEADSLKSIVGIDPSSNMLEIAKEKYSDGLFLQAGAEKLPLYTNAYDIVSISYGIRNVVRREMALKEFYRILKPNGILVILEFSKKEKPNILEKLIAFYVKTVLPFIGGIVSKNFNAYSYLPVSIDSFPKQDAFIGEISKIGFIDVEVHNEFANMSSTFIAKKENISKI